MLARLKLTVCPFSSIYFSTIRESTDALYSVRVRFASSDHTRTAFTFCSKRSTQRMSEKETRAEGGFSPVCYGNDLDDDTPERH